MKIGYIILAFFLTISLKLSSQNNANILFQSKNYVFPYNLAEPNKQIGLPSILKEISGLSYYDKNTFVGIQDEKGIMFFIDINKGEIKKKIKFDTAGDYEDIELLDKDAWIIKSNGHLLQVKNYANDKKRKVKKYKTFLSSHNNSEGLAYNQTNNCLLIACKGYPYAEKQKFGKSEKAIYAFDLQTKTLLPQPAIIIKLDSIKQYIKHTALEKAGLKLLSVFDSSMGDLTFQPSGIAVHPLTQDYYVLGSVGKLLLVYSSKGDLKSIIKLKEKLFPQAEGICFDPQGNLYISNEGKDKKASILTFKIENH